MSLVGLMNKGATCVQGGATFQGWPLKMAVNIDKVWGAALESRSR